MAHADTLEIKRLENELNYTYRDGTLRAVTLLRLATVLQQRAVRLQSVDDFDRAVKRHFEIRSRFLVGHELWANYLILPPHIYRLRYSLTETNEDLERAIQAAERAMPLVLSCYDPTLLAQENRRLVKLYLHRYERIGDTTDLVEALRNVKTGFNTAVKDIQGQIALQTVDRLSDRMANNMSSSEKSMLVDHMPTLIEQVEHLKDKTESPAEYYRALGQLHYISFLATGDEMQFSRAEDSFLASLNSPEAPCIDPQNVVDGLRKSYYTKRGKICDSGAILFAQIALGEKIPYEPFQKLQRLEDLAMLDLMMWIETGHIYHLKARVSRLTKALDLDVADERESNSIAKEVAMGHLMIYQETSSAEDIEISLRMIEYIEARWGLEQHNFPEEVHWSLWQTQDLEAAIAHAQAKHGNNEAISKFREKDINLMPQARDEGTPLHRAVEANLIGVVRWLVRYGGADLHWQVEDEGTALHLAAWIGCVDIARYLVQMGADIDAKDYGEDLTPLKMAIESRDAMMVHLLIDEGPTIDTDDLKDAMAVACEKGHERLLASLWPMVEESGRDFHGEYHIFLQAAISNKHTHIVRFLLSSTLGARMPDNRKRLLSEAACNGDIRTLRYLLDTGVDVNVGFEKDSPLSQAIKAGHEGAAEFLLRRGAWANYANWEGMRPLHYAANRGLFRLVCLLLDAGSSIAPTCKTGSTPLMQACMGTRSAVADLLVTRHAHGINHKNRYGITPLWISFAHGDFRTTELLLKAGADPTTMDKFGRSTLTLARRQTSAMAAMVILSARHGRGVFLVNRRPGTTKGSLPKREFSGRYCRVCTRTVAKDCACYYCAACLRGSFIVCEECFARRAHCLEWHHTLMRQEAKSEGRLDTMDYIPQAT